MEEDSGNYEHHWLWSLRSLGLWLDNELVWASELPRGGEADPELVAELTEEEQAACRLGGRWAIQPPLMW